MEANFPDFLHLLHFKAQGGGEGHSRWKVVWVCAAIKASLFQAIFFTLETHHFTPFFSSGDPTHISFLNCFFKHFFSPIFGQISALKTLILVKICSQNFSFKPKNLFRIDTAFGDDLWLATDLWPTSRPNRQACCLQSLVVQKDLILRKIKSC